MTPAKAPHNNDLHFSDEPKVLSTITLSEDDDGKYSSREPFRAAKVICNYIMKILGFFYTGKGISYTSPKVSDRDTIKGVLWS